MENTEIKRFNSFNRFNLGLALLTLLILVLGGIVGQLIFQFDSYNLLLLITLLLVAYCVILLGLALTRTFRVISSVRTQVQTRVIDRPVDRIVEKIVEKPVIKVVEKPVIRVVEKQIEPKIIRQVKVVKQKSKKLKIPHFNYVGSSVSKRYHTRFCRLGKLVKKKFKVHSNSQSFFIKRHYKPCKACILKTKKI
ncbi:hypothetical protein FJZ17_02840 [Candidatus Pacearchaeota archaeon]|nr:hypothetical protein [Candidatus Pacearchaeota archaeon]